MVGAGDIAPRRTHLDGTRARRRLSGSEYCAGRGDVGHRRYRSAGHDAVVPARQRPSGCARRHVSYPCDRGHGAWEPAFHQAEPRRGSAARLSSNRDGRVGFRAGAVPIPDNRRHDSGSRPLHPWRLDHRPERESGRDRLSYISDHPSAGGRNSGCTRRDRRGARRRPRRCRHSGDRSWPLAHGYDRGAGARRDGRPPPSRRCRCDWGRQSTGHRASDSIW